jgi:hypothetical protein
VIECLHSLLAVAGKPWLTRNFELNLNLRLAVPGPGPLGHHDVRVRLRGSDDRDAVPVEINSESEIGRGVVRTGKARAAATGWLPVLQRRWALAREGTARGSVFLGADG